MISLSQYADTLINFALLLTAIINLVFAAIIFFNRKHTAKLSVLFTLLAGNISLWTFVIIFYRLTADPEEALFLLRLLYFIPVFIPFLFLLFAYLYSNRPASVFRIPFLRFSIFLASFFVALATFYSDAFVSGVEIPLQGEKIIHFGKWYILYVLYFLFTFSWGFYLLARQFFATNEQTLKMQVLYLFIGTFIASSISLITNLFLPWYGYFELNWFGNITTIFFVAFIFYAIVRHKLFDVKIVTTELLTFGIWLLFLFRIIFSDSPSERLLNIVSLAIAVPLGIFIIQGIKKEIAAKEHLEEAKKKLENANHELTELDRQKTEFVSLASHQLRAPVATIRGYTSLVLEGSFGGIPAGAREALERVADSGKQMADMIEDFLNISRIEQGKMHYVMQKFDFGQVIERVVENIRKIAEEKGISINLVTPPSGRKFCVFGDEGKLRQVVSNLIDNSVKYTEKGEVRVELSHDIARNKIHLEISDSGIGISKEDQWQLFAKFSRGENANLTDVHGTGLGLYVAKEMLRAHNGLIWVESEGVGFGTTFHVELDAMV